MVLFNSMAYKIMKIIYQLLVTFPDNKVYNRYQIDN
jgi:hypothetical protein